MVTSRTCVLTAMALVLATAGWGGRDAHASSARAPLDEVSSSDFASRVAAFGDSDESSIDAPLKKLPKVVFDHVMIDPANPNLIIPCIKVLRGFWMKAKHKPNIQIVISLRYKSNGQTKFKLVVMPLRDMEITTHHNQPANRRQLLVETTLDITGAPIDPGSVVEGKARIVEGTPAAALEHSF